MTKIKKECCSDQLQINPLASANGRISHLSRSQFTARCPLVLLISCAPLYISVRTRIPGVCPRCQNDSLTRFDKISHFLETSDKLGLRGPTCPVSLDHTARLQPGPALCAPFLSVASSPKLAKKKKKKVLTPETQNTVSWYNSLTLIDISR